MVSSPSVFVLGGAGASQLPGCEGEGGPVSFGVVFVVCFCFETSRRASQLPGLRRGNVLSQLWWWCRRRLFLFWGGRGPVSFRAVKGKGGQSALELCSAGNGGESASGGCEGGMM